MIEHQAKEMSAALEALKTDINQFEKIIIEARKLRYDDIYFNEEVVYTAAKDIKELNQAKDRYRFKLYLGLVKYALAWYDYPTREMRQRRDHILECICDSRYKVVRDNLIDIAKDMNNMAVLMAAMHYFKLDILELYEESFYGSINVHISNAYYRIRKSIEENSLYLQFREPERHYSVQKKECENFLALQWRNYTDALANYQLFANLNRTAMLKLTSQMDTDNFTRISKIYKEEPDPHGWRQADILRPERQDMKDYLEQNNIWHEKDKGTCREWVTGTAPLLDVPVQRKTTPRQVDLLDEMDRGIHFLAKPKRQQRKDVDGEDPEVNAQNQFVGATSPRNSTSSSWGEEVSMSELAHDSSIISPWETSSSSLPPPAPAQHAFVPTEMVTRAKSKAEKEKEVFVAPKKKNGKKKGRKKRR